ncbi:uncharacterized protein LACBIDRAFT_335826 [Laccaria bicolor S238N-H82]|uniref:Predicted protein n=1 Tax=Laccaria bicolor (strain S238N-H82 / ATCC MYA-4686) TaxID=486041 RepID=B0E3J3_LACBS|nr:uncharacterized protein LACBIDRAFT_335826 [Laccaria bicolor S238N-H82]EDQ98586.1 predicted protein [Laccaria bicolor S238N-H82]|eukprot:XP_001890762.1 predicted protein [Laccaria bicolor S238N-H82]
MPGQIGLFTPSEGIMKVGAAVEFAQCPSQGQSANSLSGQGSSHNEKAQLANTLSAAHPAIPWVIGVEFPVAACPNGEDFITEQAVFSNASTNRTYLGKARIRSMSKVQTHPTKGKERIRSVSKDK